jgi:hypothetical protein
MKLSLLPTLLPFLVGLSAADAVAQIPMSSYTRTYDRPSRSCGLYFQAPTDFRVTHLEVPCDFTGTSYSIALYKLTAAPPAYPTRVDGKPLLYVGHVPKDTKTAVPASVGLFKKGEWCVVIGHAHARKNGAKTNNMNYGSSNTGGNTNPSEILGVPVALGLAKANTASSIDANQGVLTGLEGLYFSAYDSGNISRVMITVTSPNSKSVDGAQSCVFCPDSNGSAKLAVASESPFIAGKVASLVMQSGGDANTGAILCYGIKRNNVLVPNLGRLCVAGVLEVVPMPGKAVPAGPTGGSTLSGSLPSGPSTLGLSLVFQGALLITGSRPIPLTNGLEVTIGR